MPCIRPCFSEFFKTIFIIREEKKFSTSVHGFGYWPKNKEWVRISHGYFFTNQTGQTKPTDGKIFIFNTHFGWIFLRGLPIIGLLLLPCYCSIPASSLLQLLPTPLLQPSSSSAPYRFFGTARAAFYGKFKNYTIEKLHSLTPDHLTKSYLMGEAKKHHYFLRNIITH